MTTLTKGNLWIATIGYSHWKVVPKTHMVRREKTRTTIITHAVTIREEEAKTIMEITFSMNEEAEETIWIAVVVEDPQDE